MADNATSGNITYQASTDSTSDSGGSESIQTTAYGVLFLLSLTGNSLVLVVVKRNLNGTRKVATNILIAHMAFADILTTSLGIPTMIWRIWANGQWFTGGLVGLILCKVDTFVVETAFAVSASTITIIALERYFVVFYPTRKIMPSPRAFSIGLVAWLCSASFYSPKLHVSTLIERNNSSVCYARTQLIQPWRHIEAFVFLIFFLLTLGFYLAIIFKVRCHKSPTRTPEARMKPRQIARERMNRRVLWQSLVIIFVHYFCWIPYLVVYLSCLFSKNSLSFCKPSILTHFLVLFFGYCNASANPFVYAILSDNFRSGFRLILCRVFCCGERVYPSSPARNRIKMRTQQEPAKTDSPAHKPHEKHELQRF
jgi:hypothetical protein